MKFLVTIEPTPEGAARLDAQPGGPGPFFARVGERFRPEAFYVRADRRAAVWVLDLADAAEVAELLHLSLAHTGATPELVPVLTGQEAVSAVPAAIAKARG